MELVGPNTMNAPWGLSSRLKLLIIASRFFNVQNYDHYRKLIGPPKPRSPQGKVFSVSDFLNYLDVEPIFEKPPNAFQVARQLALMADAALLLRLDSGQSGGVGGLGNVYMNLGPTESQSRRNTFRYVQFLGPEFLFNLCTSALVHITGTTRSGHPSSGTGFVIHPKLILTCKHVLDDLSLDKQQTFQRRTFDTDSELMIHTHDHIDVAIIEVDGVLVPAAGAVFRQPVAAETVYTLGYPQIPCSRDAVPIIQPGTVTNPNVVSFSNEVLFLYSAIARPGNSGGPVVSSDGYIVGIVSRDLTTDGSEDAFSPHYAGVPASTVRQAVNETLPKIDLPFEHFD